MTVWRMEDFAALIPESLKGCSGKVFYSGRKAFESPSDIYILGINPGGDPSDPDEISVGVHTTKVLDCRPCDWSEYRDEPWKKDSEPGSTPFQRRLQYLSNKISIGLGEIPASNLIFKRSTVFSKLQGDARHLAKACWPFHKKVIDTLGVKIVVCLGKPASDFVREKLNAHQLIEEFDRVNRFHPRSVTHKNLDCIQVVRLSHPSRADWTKSETDPTGLVVRALCRLGSQQLCRRP